MGISRNPDLPAGTVMQFALQNAPIGWLKTDGSNKSRTNNPALFNALSKKTVVTFTTASLTGTVVLSNHGLAAGTIVRFTTTGVLPTGLTAGNNYFVRSSNLNASTFEISAFVGGPVVSTFGIDSGVHTMITTPFGSGDGSTTFGLPNITPATTGLISCIKT